MALPSSGAITLSDVNTNIGASATANITMNDTAVRLLSTGDTTTNPVTMNGLYGKSWIWTTNISQSGFSDYRLTTVQADSSGNTYALAYEQNSNTVTVFCINAVGIVSWATALGSATFNIRYAGSGADSIAIDSSGNVYVGVVCQNIATPTTYRTGLVKLNSSGAVQWSSLLSVPTGGAGFGLLGITGFDSSGNVYFGSNIDLTFATRATTIVKYNSSGAIQWQKQVNLVTASSMVLDATNGYIYLGGQFYYSGSYTGAYIGKFDLNLTASWERWFGFSTTQNSNTASGIAVTSSQEVVVCTIGFASGIGDALVLAKYDSSGSLSWKVSSGQRLSSGNAKLSIDSSNNPYVAAFGPTGGPQYQIWFKFNTSGSLTAQRNIIPTGAIGYGNDVVPSIQGNYFYTGILTNTSGASAPNGMTVLKVPNTLTTSGTYGLATFSAPSTSYTFSATSDYVSASISSSVSTTSWTEVTGAITGSSVSSSYTKTVYPI
jgi:hypothetical protein